MPRQELLSVGHRASEQGEIYGQDPGGEKERDGGPDCEVSLLYESVSEWSVCAHILNIENQIDFESCCMNRVASALSPGTLYGSVNGPSFVQHVSSLIDRSKSFLQATFMQCFVFAYQRMHQGQFGVQCPRTLQLK